MAIVVELITEFAVVLGVKVRKAMVPLKAPTLGDGGAESRCCGSD
jgi:hypothetical protein